MRIALQLVVAVAIVCPSGLKGQTPLTTELVASGLTLPVYATAPATDFDRLFLVELAGQIKILRDGVVQAAPFLDLRSVVQSSPNFEGVFGMAFHPQYASNGFFYVYYSDLVGGVTLARYQVSADPELADAASGMTLLQIPTPLDGHEGGSPLFGPDGFLYLAIGDAEPQNDLNCNGQNLQLLIGKMLRLDVDGDDFPADSNRNYAVPPSNPFVGDASVPDEVWAIGFRNPWRSSFDRVTGELYISENGQNLREEINVEPAGFAGGLNYGWPVMEGGLCFPNTCAQPVPVCNGPALTLPFYEYDHTMGCSVIGGYVYRGGDIPDLRGTYFFGDFCGSSSGAGIFSFRKQGLGITDFQDRSVELAPGGGLDIASIASWGEDAQGELYVIDHFGGEVFQLVADVPATGAFVDLGPFGIPGVAGEPLMTGSGDLTPGSASGYTIDVVGAAPSALGFVFFGTAVNATAFYGGTFYPFPFLGSRAFGFDAGGSLSVSTALPASFPGGVSIAQQFFFLDPVALHGVSGSNGLRLDVP